MGSNYSPFSHTFHQPEELHSLKAQELNGQVWRGWSKPSRRLKLGIFYYPVILWIIIKLNIRHPYWQTKVVDDCFCQVDFWWWFQFIFLFTLNLGEMIDQFDKHMFQMGWFSHQLGRWWVLGGSSHDLVQWLIIMWGPIQMAFLWLANGGLLWRPKWLLLPKDCQKTFS